eukprot:TRINITY_DN33957_c0_g1_i1.p1 TRINITY_DN33957_c0_g1~~TRINITY_DN33957_c0_g1_i1.p1  ORF type:complete len:277 (-),score=2.94 TRINITY_DN33957_c0_g1_i1:201-995(-)
MAAAAAMQSLSRSLSKLPPYDNPTVLKNHIQDLVNQYPAFRASIENQLLCLTCPTTQPSISLSLIFGMNYPRSPPTTSVSGNTPTSLRNLNSCLPYLLQWDASSSNCTDLTQQLTPMLSQIDAILGQGAAQPPPAPTQPSSISTDPFGLAAISNSPTYAHNAPPPQAAGGWMRSPPQNPSYQSGVAVHRPAHAQPQTQSSAAPTSAAQDEGDECCICMTAPKEAVLVPCGHICACVECANQLQRTSRCPICRQSITQVIKGYRV